VSSSCKFGGKRVKGNGNIVTETRSGVKTSKIKLLGPMDVILEEGPASIRVEADENLMKYIVTKTDNGWLKIRFKSNLNVYSSTTIKVYVTTPKITDVVLAGSGNISCRDKFFAENDIELDLAGSGNFNMKVDAPKIKVGIAGSGSVNISGETRDVEVDIAGSGNYNGYDLKAENANINIAGSGDVNVFADVRLNANIMGSGNVNYKGNATVDKKVMGSGGIAKTF
jgi:hypothetical protein